VAEALRAALAQDGRGVVLLAADPELSAVGLHRVLRAVRRARTARIELALREPHGKREVGTVVTALPLEVVRKDDGAGATAIASGRVHVHVDGKGLAFVHDGRALEQLVRTPAELATMLERIARAYPRERTLRVTIGDDATLATLVDLLVATVGGGKPRFAAVGWLDSESRSPARPDGAADRKLELRAALASSRTAVRIDQPFPLAGDDQGRLQSFAEQLWRCVPELETTVPAMEARIGSVPRGKPPSPRPIISISPSEKPSTWSFCSAIASSASCCSRVMRASIISCSEPIFCS